MKKIVSIICSFIFVLSLTTLSGCVNYETVVSVQGFYCNYTNKIQLYKAIEEVYNINNDFDAPTASLYSQMIDKRDILIPIEGNTYLKQDNGNLKKIENLYFMIEEIEKDFEVKLYQFNNSNQEYTLIKPGEFDYYESY